MMQNPVQFIGLTCIMEQVKMLKMKIINQQYSF
jgi:hypothetical protein